MKYMLAVFFFVLFKGSAGIPQSNRLIIDPIDMAIAKAKMESNRLKVDDAKRNQTIAILLSERE